VERCGCGMPWRMTDDDRAAGFMIKAIWPVDELADTAALAPYFERTQASGFGGLQDYLADLDNPKWFETAADRDDE
jgi:hypothetical protein